MVIESEAVGGQGGTSSMIRNYLGFPRGISGMRLAQRARFQATRFGARIYTGLAAEAIEPAAGPGNAHVVRTEGGVLRAKAVLVATGVTYRRIGIEPQGRRRCTWPGMPLASPCSCVDRTWRPPCRTT